MEFAEKANSQNKDRILPQLNPNNNQIQLKNKTSDLPGNIYYAQNNIPSQKATLINQGSSGKNMPTGLSPNCSPSLVSHTNSGNGQMILSNQINSKNQEEKKMGLKKVQVINILKKIKQNRYDGRGNQIQYDNRQSLNYQMTMDHRRYEDNYNLRESSLNQGFSNYTHNNQEQIIGQEINFEIQEGFATVKPNKKLTQKSIPISQTQTSMTPMHQKSLSQQESITPTAIQKYEFNPQKFSGGSPPVMNRRAKAQGLNQKNQNLNNVSEKINSEKRIQESHQYQKQFQTNPLNNVYNNSSSTSSINKNSKKFLNQEQNNQSQYYDKSHNSQSNQSNFNQSQYYISQNGPDIIPNNNLDYSIKKNNAVLKKPPLQLQLIPSNGSSFIYKDNQSQNLSQITIAPNQQTYTQQQASVDLPKDKQFQQQYQIISLKEKQGNDSNHLSSNTPNQKTLNFSLLPTVDLRSRQTPQNQAINPSSSSYYAKSNQSQNQNSQKNLKSKQLYTIGAEESYNSAKNVKEIQKQLKESQQETESLKNAKSGSMIPSSDQSKNSQRRLLLNEKQQLDFQNNFISTPSHAKNQLGVQNRNLKNEFSNHTMIMDLNFKDLGDRQSVASPSLIVKKGQNHKRSETATDFISKNSYGSLQHPNTQTTLNGQAKKQTQGEINLYNQDEYGLTSQASTINNQAQNLNLQSILQTNDNQISLANRGPEEQISVKSILKKIAQYNNSTNLSSQHQLALQHAQSNPPQNNLDEQPESKQIQINQNQSAGIRGSGQKINQSISTKNSNKHAFNFNQQKVNSDNRINNYGTVNSQNTKIVKNSDQYLLSEQLVKLNDNSSNKTFKIKQSQITQFMIAREQIQEIQSLNGKENPKQLAFMTLKQSQGKSRPSNHSSNSNLRISLSNQLPVKNNQSNNTSMHKFTPNDLLNLRQDQTMTPDIFALAQKAMTTANKMSRQVNLKEGIDSFQNKKESFQRNLLKNKYFQEEGSAEQQLPAGETPSFNNQGEILTFSSHKKNNTIFQDKPQYRILPVINRQKTLSKNLNSFIPVDQHAYTSQHTIENSYIDQNNDSLKSVGGSNPVSQQKYYKMIQKFVGKGSQHQRNLTTQIDSPSKAQTYNNHLGEQKLTQVLKLKLINTNESPSLNFKHGRDDIDSQQIDRSNKTNQMSTPILQIPTQIKQSESYNEENQDESPYMNEQRKNNFKKINEETQKKRNAEDNYSPTQDNFAKKKSIVQSYQTNVLTVNNITPSYDKKQGVNQLQSVLQLNEFKQSLDNKSTEMSSKQEMISRYNSGQMPLIQSVASSQMKSNSAHNGLTNQNFSSMSANNYQQLLQKMISIRESQPGRSPSDNQMKSSLTNKGQKTSNAGKKVTSLIKEDSNEEKSSSNSNSYQEIVIDPKVQPLKKDDLFSKKLKILLGSKHKRQRTQIQQVFGKLQSTFVEKRYDEDQKPLTQMTNRQNDVQSQKLNQNESDDQSFQSVRTMILLSNRSNKDTLVNQFLDQKDNNDPQLFISLISQNLSNKSTFQYNKTFDKSKNWLLDSTRFNYQEIAENQKQDELRRLQQLKDASIKDNASDTVEFDNSSSNGTPKALKKLDKEEGSSKGIETPQNLMKTPKSKANNQQLQVQQSHQSPSIRLSRQIVDSHLNSGLKSQNQSNFITIEQQDEESVDVNQTTINEANISVLVNQILHMTSGALDLQKAREQQITELHSRLNVDLVEKILLYPKYKLPTLENFFQPSYYDTIYIQYFGQNKSDQPTLEPNFNFD